MATLSQLRKVVLQEISSELSVRGIVHRRKGQDFCMPTRTGWGYMHVTFVPHPGTDFEIEVSGGVRIDAVEQLVEGQEPGRKNGESITLGVSLEDLMGVWGLLRWTIATSSDVHRVVVDLVDKSEQFLLPYIRRYCDPRQALEALAGPEELAKQHMPIMERRAYRLLALAALVGTPAEFEREVGRWELELGRKGTVDMHRYREFCEMLRQSNMDFGGNAGA